MKLCTDVLNNMLNIFRGGAISKCKYLKYTVVTAKCACIRNTNVCFSNVCMQVKLVNILTYVQILSYKDGVTIP